MLEYTCVYLRILAYRSSVVKTVDFGLIFGGVLCIINMKELPV